MQRPYLIIALSLCCGLSCALWHAPGRVAAPTALRGHAAAPAAPELERVVAELERWHTRLSADEKRATAAALVRESERHALELDLVLGVIRVESAFNNFARSDKGALGLMQVMPATGEIVARDLGIAWRGPRTLLDPVTNVRIGTAYLAEMRRQFGSVDRALAAYNWGPGAIQRRLAGGSPVPLEYASNVQDASASLSAVRARAAAR
jgi:soluble lytic murein transglycosylase